MTKEQLKEKLIAITDKIFYNVIVYPYTKETVKYLKSIWIILFAIAAIILLVFGVWEINLYCIEDTFNTNKQNHNVIVVTCETSSATEPFGISTYEGYYVGQFEYSRFTLLDKDHNEIVFVNRKCTVLETRTTNRQ